MQNSLDQNAVQFIMANMERLQKEAIQKDLERKMVFLTGPRQVGKTTLARSYHSLWPDLQYLNFDSDEDRMVLLKQEWDRKAPLVILDEFHKLKRWKQRIKGVYDKEGIPPRLLVTGSARMDVYRRGADSLAGRYFLHRLHPLSVRELSGQGGPAEILESLMKLGGFPEPFLSQSEEDSRRWRKIHLERIIRLDIQDLEPVREIQSLLLLVEMLRERVGSPVSYASLARDLEVSPHTVKKWIQVLERMYILFTVTPYHRNIARAILKEPKIYFYDTGAVRKDEGARFENAAACHLVKWLDYLEDAHGKETHLHFVRTKEKKEVDFLVIIDGQKELLIETKLSETAWDPSLLKFQAEIRAREAIQLVCRTSQRRSAKEGVSLLPAAEWLMTLEI